MPWHVATLYEDRAKKCSAERAMGRGGEKNKEKKIKE
ncbi:hypothetical protein RT761_00482 [Atribacter laminatus]|uniref:Uncharacterized protein n=1 Tax=Atribacter laminatus TaxID=2847778 RepID=A0A7T1AJW4_ATRLM|nr:hypothetical protein RT761_00482 [Atribacter laminatus]